jgi:hypothetical protein
MISVAGLTRRLAAGVLAIVVAGGLAVAVAGTAQAAVGGRWGFAYVDAPAVPGVPDLSHQAGSWPPGFVVHSKPAPGARVIVTFPRIASAGGVVLVTAVVDVPVWCQALTWARSGPNEVVVVRCYKPGGAPTFAPFTVAYSHSSKGPVPPGRGYGYVHYSPALGVVARFNSAGGVNTVTTLAPGIWRVRLPGLGSAGHAGNVQLTAVNPAVPAKCEVGGWASAPGQQIVEVRCYNSLATPLKTGWTLTYQRGRAVTGAQPKHFAYTFDNMPLAAGPYAPVPPAVNFNSAAGINTIRSAGGGLRLVLLPRVGALPDTVLVTTVGSAGRFCSLLTRWATFFGQVTVRDVACYTAAGVLQNTGSFVTYTSAR